MHYLRALLKTLIPKKYRPGAIELYVRLRAFLYRGNRYICPVCQGNFRKLLPYGVRARPNAQCPGCGSLERHRLLWLYLKERTGFFTRNLRVLDVAPMPVLQQRWRKLPNLDYLSVDIASPTAMVQMDITDMKFPEHQFDCILCYHVLEHIPDDRKAMQELFRVLKPGGWAILQSPIDSTRTTTLEDPSISTPEERERAFGQSDHVRVYGLDYKDRLGSAGFIVRVDSYVKQLPGVIVERYRLYGDEDIYFCVKPDKGL